jgi:hypothetical protein
MEPVPIYLYGFMSARSQTVAGSSQRRLHPRCTALVEERAKNCHKLIASQGANACHNLKTGGIFEILVMSRSSKPGLSFDPNVAGSRPARVIVRKLLERLRIGCPNRLQGGTSCVSL